MIYDHTDNKTNVKVTIADSGYMRMTADERNLILTLYNGYTFEEVEESKKKRKRDREYPHTRQKFEKQEVIFELTGLDFNRTDEDLFKNNFQMLNLAQLEYAEDSLQNEYNKEINRFAVSHKTGNYFKKETLLEENQDKFAKKRRRIIKRNVSNDKRKTNKNKPHNVKKDIKLNQEKETIEPLSEDTLNTEPQPYRADSIYNLQSKKDKLSIIHQALTYARTAQNNISNTTKTFYHRAERIRRHQIEWHRKFSLSFACLVFFFIGAPFGAIVRKGGFGTPVVISVLFFILYYILSISGEKFVREGVMPAYIGMWLSSYILMPLGIFLTYKATTDSVILNSDTYLLFFKKLFKRFRKKSE
jgi:lipopolysaccharide export system permease protein